MDRERYARQVMLSEVGEAGQQRLAEASVLIVGLGGLGCPAALYLTAAGVGRIGLADPDTVSLSNLQRQVLYDETQVGRLKVDAAHERLSALSSHTVFEKFPQGLQPELVSKYDLVLDCCDNFATRYLIDDACAAAGKPWIHGALGEFSGQVCLLNGRSGKRYIDLYPDRGALCALPKATAGVLGPVAGVIGTIQASEAVKFLLGSASCSASASVASPAAASAASCSASASAASPAAASSASSSLDGRLLQVDLLTLNQQIFDL